MKPFNRSISQLTCTSLLLVMISFMLLACGSNTPYLDSKFGDVTQDAYQNQSIDNAVGSNEQVSARELRLPMDNYLKGTTAPAALQGVVTTGSGSAVSR